MNQITQTNQQQTMSSREIAKLTKKRHDNVLRDIRNMFEQLGIVGELKTEFVEKINNLGFKVKDPYYLLTRRECEILVTGYDVVRRAAVIDRWFELETSLRDQQPKIPQTYAEALQLAADQAKQLELAKPKVEFVDRLVERTTEMNSTQVAQKLGKSAVWLNKQLEDLNVFNKNVKRGRAFKQWFVDDGYGVMKQTELGYSQALFTPAGELWIHEKLTSEGII